MTLQLEEEERSHPNIGFVVVKQSGKQKEKETYLSLKIDFAFILYYTD